MSAALETRCGGCGAEIPTDHAALWEPATGKRYCSDRCSRRPPPQEVNPVSETPAAPVGEAREGGSNPWAMFFAAARERDENTAEVLRLQGELAEERGRPKKETR